MPILRKVSTSQGTVSAVAASNARQTFVPLPAKAAGVAARVQTVNVAAIRAPNARQNSR